jgi:hypothetical protein
MIIKRRESSAGLDHARIVDALADPFARQPFVSIEYALLDQGRKPFGAGRQFAKQLISITMSEQRHAFLKPVLRH